GDEAPVHHVDVDPVGAAGFAHRDLVGEAREVGAEDRGGDAHHHSPPESRRSIRDPRATCAPAAGVCDTTVAPAVVGAPVSVCASPTASPTCWRRSCACAKLRPTTSGTFTTVGPALTRSATGLGVGSFVPAP